MQTTVTELSKPVTSISPWAEAWRRFKRHRLAYWSLWVLGLMVLAVLLGPLFYKVGINEIDFKARLVGPTAKHPLGTDDLGRDVLARVLYGGRISLAVGFAAMLMAITVGVLIGAIVTEQIFRIPGIGSLLIDAILRNDTPVIMAVTFVFSCLVILFNLIADVLYGWLDPRISYQ